MGTIPDLEVIGNTDGLITKIHLYLSELKQDAHTPYLVGYENDDFVKNITRVRFYPDGTKNPPIKEGFKN